MLACQRLPDRGIKWRLDGFCADLYALAGDLEAEDSVTGVESGAGFKIENLRMQVGGSPMRVEFQHEEGAFVVVLFRCEW